jgi:hypothetical protein
MTTEERISLMDKALQALKRNSRGSIPELLDGQNQFPNPDTEKDLDYRAIEYELLERELIEETPDTQKYGRNGGINGFLYLQLSGKGKNLLSKGKSIGDIIRKEEKKESDEDELKQLQLELARFQKEMIEKEREIKSLTIEVAKLQKMNIIYALASAGMTGLIAVFYNLYIK